MEFRHEWKHEISYADMLLLRQRLRAVTKADEHAMDGKYEIRSLYFDNLSDKALREKLDGINIREKFRIRYYNGDTSLLHLEKKSKIGGLCNKQSAALTKEEAQAIVDERIASLPKPQAETAVYITENMSVKVKEVSTGDDKSLILDCDVETYDLYTVVEANLNKYLASAYKIDNERVEKGLPKANSTVVRQNIKDDFNSDFAEAQRVQKSVSLRIYEVADNVFSLYLSDEVIDTLYGDYKKAVALVNGAEKCVIDGEEISIKNNNDSISIIEN